MSTGLDFCFLLSPKIIFGEGSPTFLHLTNSFIRGNLLSVEGVAQISWGPIYKGKRVGMLIYQVATMSQGRTVNQERCCVPLVTGILAAQTLSRVETPFLLWTTST